MMFLAFKKTLSNCSKKSYKYQSFIAKNHHIGLVFDKKLTNYTL